MMITDENFPNYFSRSPTKLLLFPNFYIIERIYEQLLLFNSSSNTLIRTVFYKSQTYLHNLRIEIGEYEVDMVGAPANCKDQRDSSKHFHNLNSISARLR